MTYSRYINIVLFAALISWLAFFLVIFKLSVYQSLFLALPLFFITFFIAISGTFTVFGFYFRVWLFKDDIIYKHVNVSFRQGIFLGLISVFSLVLQMLKLLNWWSGFLILSIFVLLEFYLSSQDSG